MNKIYLKMRYLNLIAYLMIATCSYANDLPNQAPETIAIAEIPTFSNQSPKVQQTLQLLLKLAGQGLHYQYGSSDPKIGGMDCSGTLFYALNQMGISNVPRSSDLQYNWVKTQGQFYSSSETASTITAPEFSHLRPGDLLFWSGTYQIQRAINVTHVMMYLGQNQAGNH